MILCNNSIQFIRPVIVAKTVQCQKLATIIILSDSQPKTKMSLHFCPDLSLHERKGFDIFQHNPKRGQTHPTYSSHRTS